MTKLNPDALDALKNGQRQLDEDGAAVGVSRQALDEMMADHARLADLEDEWGRLHQQVIEERAAALREVATLKRTRDDLHEANNRYLERARDAEAWAKKAKVAIEEMIADRDAAYALLDAAALSRPVERAKGGAMTPDEHRLEDLKQMARYAGPVVSFEATHPYYLASCDKCGWVGSSELCGTDSGGDDSDVYCPRCHSSGADCGKVAEKIEGAKARRTSGELVPVVTAAMVEAANAAFYRSQGDMHGAIEAAIHARAAAGEE